MTRAELRRGSGILSTVLWLAASSAMSGVAQADTASRPQLVVHRAEADLAAETLLITGEKLLWNNDGAVVVTLAGTPLAILGATESYVLAQLPPGLSPGSYLLKVSRGAGTVQNDAFDLTIGAVGPAGLTGPKGEMGDTGPQGFPGATGPAGPTGPAGRNGFDGAAGPAGPTGPSGPTGPKGLNARGAWSAAANYVQDDVVTEGGQTWRCQIADCAVGNLPASTNPAWELLAARGADGATGGPGPQGPTGATGPQGPQGPAGPTGPQGPAGPAGGGVPPGSVLLGHTGANQTFTVPAGVNALLVEAWGGGGGGGEASGFQDSLPDSHPGGAGGYARTAIPVTPGATFTVVVGGGGHGGCGGSGTGGFGGGGDGSRVFGTVSEGAEGGGGGGATSLVDAVGVAVLIAGGGGGGTGADCLSQSCGSFGIPFGGGIGGAGGGGSVGGTPGSSGAGGGGGAGYGVLSNIGAGGAGGPGISICPLNGNNGRDGLMRISF